MGWVTTENGATIGTQGSEDGVIERDEEHTDGARIALERNSTHAPFALTCGVYGWMFHTRYLGTAEESGAAFDAMKVRLSRILELIPGENDPEADAKYEIVIRALHDFVAEFP
jgi:hypothetical protein